MKQIVLVVLLAGLAVVLWNNHSRNAVPASEVVRLNVPTDSLEFWRCMSEGKTFLSDPRDDTKYFCPDHAISRGEPPAEILNKLFSPIGH